MGDLALDMERLRVLAQARRWDYFQLSEERGVLLITSILERDIVIPQRRSRSIIDIFCNWIDPARYACALRVRSLIPLAELWTHSRERIVPFDESIDVEGETAPFIRCREIVTLGSQLSQRAANDWATKIDLWDVLIENARDIFGDCWHFYYFANIAAGIRSQSEKYNDYNNLFDHEMSLCKRVRYARLRAGTVAWW